MSETVWCKSEGLAIHNCLELRVEVAWNGRAGVCVECVQSDPTSRGVGECARGEEGGELRKLRVQVVYLTINTKGLGGREEKDVTHLGGSRRGSCRRLLFFFLLHSRTSSEALSVIEV